MRREGIREQLVSTELLERSGEQMFPKLTSVQLARLVSHNSPRVTQADEILLEAGAAPRGVFIVISGSVEVLESTSDVRSGSDYALLYVLTAGDFSGELNTLRGAPGLVRLRGRDSGSVLQVDLQDLRRLVQNDAELSELFMRAFILRRMGILESGQSEVVLIGSSRSGDTRRGRHRQYS